MNVTIGTPPQSIQLILDTGTSDTWVNTPTSALCMGAGSLCASIGTYTANTSSTYAYVSSDFNISASSFNSAEGDFASDTFTFGSTILSSMQFGIAYSSSTAPGILGIGYTAGESQVESTGRAAYNNLPAQMVANGLIESNAYSLWLNDLEARTGNILFGGVDMARFHGSLVTIPIQKVAGSLAHFHVTLTDISFGSVIIAKNHALAIALSSGNTLTYLPDEIANAIFLEVGSVLDSLSQIAYVPCALASSTSTLNFTISSAITIAVPMSELVFSPVLSGPDTGHPTFSGGGTPNCVFGIAAAGDTPVEFGDTFMRSAYIVFDLDNNEISMVQNAVTATTGTIDSSKSTSTAIVGNDAVNSGADKVASFTKLGAIVVMSWAKIYMRDSI
jgi:Eukaryotic aspartyl protease